jgi:hypothetical protein
MNEDDECAREADRMLAAAIYLMTCHARSGCPRLACMVRHHFRQLSRHPGSGALVREMCRRLAAAWEAVMRHDERRALNAATNPPHDARPGTLH